MEPIGYIESCYKDKFATPRQAGLVGESRAQLKIRRDLQPEQALQGLENFSHLWLIFLFHKNEVSRYHAKVHPPRLGGKSIGLFATRTPHRPNPIGLSLVQILRIEKDTIHLGGVDLIEGTPILDVKPYLKEIECLPEALSGWTDSAEKPDWQVQFTQQALLTLDIWKQELPLVDVEGLITSTLKLDPRPLVYRGYEGEASPYRENHVCRLYNRDVHFRYLDRQNIEVTALNTVSE